LGPRGRKNINQGNLLPPYQRTIAIESRRSRAVTVARRGVAVMAASTLLAGVALATLIAQQPSALRPSAAVQARINTAMQGLADEFSAYARWTEHHPVFDYAGFEAKLRVVETASLPAPSLDYGNAGAEESAVTEEADETGQTEADALSRTLAVGRGDTLIKMLIGAGVDRGESQEIVTALNRLYDPRKMQLGQEMTLTFTREDDVVKVASLALAPSVERNVAVKRTPEGEFKAEQVLVPLQSVRAKAAGTIDDSLFLAARRAGVPMVVLTELIKLFSYDVDFQREVKTGDAFEVMFDRKVDPAGRPAREGDILYASMTLSGQVLRYWRYAPSDSKEPEYFNEKGQSMRKALLRTPIDGARLTSGFGMRSHPILGYTTLHKGVDFGAPTGTPIQAAGDGVVEMAGWNGAYGKYVRLKHNSTFATAYAHMSTFASGLKPGQRVRQGQIIGYVGSTGRSTGPHLHYEVHREGKQINPLSVRFPTGRALEGRELQRFREAIRATDSQILSASLVSAAD